MMTKVPEHQELRSHDIVADKRDELLRLFPEARTEDGRINFDTLRTVLGDVVDVGRERYGMTWPGKADSFRAIQSPSLATLRPAPDESVQFEITGNLIIEGDNLEVLKLLQKSYLGKVQMIYIDPPYNTGKDFIYPDDYSQSLQTYLEYTGQVDSMGRKFATNTDAQGRFHSQWLSMIYPRLYLARNLLREDGVIVISIDDAELRNLWRVCDEIFGEECYAGCISRATGTPTGGGNKSLVNKIDYLLVYGRTPEVFVEGLPLSDKEAAIYDRKDSQGRYLTRPLRRTGGEDRREDRPTMFYPIDAPDGSKVLPYGPTGYESRWICGADGFAKLNRAGLIEWRQADNGSWTVYQKFYAEGRIKQPSNLWTDQEGNKKATRDLRAMFGGEKVFDFPKPVGLVADLIRAFATAPDSLILDFFAGSGVSAEATFRVNAEDKGKRQFILVQLPEPTGREDYETIAEITKERVRRAAATMGSEDETKFCEPQDRGFRVFKLAESNFTAWDAEGPTDAASLNLALEKHVNHIREGRSDADLLNEILLKSGYELTVPVEVETIEGMSVYSVDNGSLLISLGGEPTLELVRTMATRHPNRVLMLDASFAGNDQLKANAAQTFKHAGASEGDQVVFRTI